MTVRPRPAFDPELCFRVALPQVLDDRAAAWLQFPPHPRCVHLHAAETITWTGSATRVLAHRLAGRPPIVLDEMPEPLADAIATDVLVVLDWAYGGAA